MVQRFTHQLPAAAGDQYVRLVSAQESVQFLAALFRCVADAHPLLGIAVGAQHQLIAQGGEFSSGRFQRRCGTVRWRSQKKGPQSQWCPRAAKMLGYRIVFLLLIQTDPFASWQKDANRLHKALQPLYLTALVRCGLCRFLGRSQMSGGRRHGALVQQLLWGYCTTKRRLPPRLIPSPLPGGGEIPHPAPRWTPAQ